VRRSAGGGGRVDAAATGRQAGDDGDRPARRWPATIARQEAEQQGHAQEHHVNGTT
jgi:hypothetical protein